MMQPNFKRAITKIYKQRFGEDLFSDDGFVNVDYGELGKNEFMLFVALELTYNQQNRIIQRHDEVEGLIKKVEVMLEDARRGDCLPRQTR